MRKALMTVLLAATAVMPVAAQAQDSDRGEMRRERQAQRAAQAPQQRVERRADGGGQDGGGRRYQNRAPQAQAQAQAVQAPATAVQTPAGRRDRGRVAAAAEPYRQQRDAAIAAGDQRTAAAAERYGRLAAQNEARYGRGSNDRDNRGDWRNNGNSGRNDNNRNDGRDWRNNNNGRNDGRDWRNNGRNDRGGWTNNGRNDRRDWNRGWRNDNRYDWQRYRYSNRNIFRPGPYYSPYRGYSYNRFSIGLILNSGFYSSRYWITDPYQYRLPPAPPGTRWVRYYDDVLLVDMYSGEVIDAIYDFFW